MSTKETICYLEMNASGDLRPPTKDNDRVEVKQRVVPDPLLSRYLYSTVGKDHYWIDRLHWTDEQWLERLGQPNVEMWVAYLMGSMAGYFELDMEEQGNVEIAFFGLLPRFIGRGIGGHLLTVATQRAWQMGASRVWLHTSSLDHPHALSNYQARGFRVFKREVVCGAGH